MATSRTPVSATWAASRRTARTATSTITPPSSSTSRPRSGTPTSSGVAPGPRAPASSSSSASPRARRSLDEARDILAEAQKRLLVVGDKVEDQVADKDLKQLTGLMYMRIPKKKAVGAAPETWILSKENIMLWTQDLDAFESALYSTDIEEDKDFDPFAGMRLTMEWMAPDSKEGKFLYQWWPKATARRHHYGEMQIKNLWRVERD